MAATGNLKFAIFVITLLALAAGIALIVQITKKTETPLPPTTEKPSTPGSKSTQNATNGEVFPYDNIRLPRHVIPLVYDVYMNPRIEKHEFDGTIDITLQVNFPRNFIVLHSKKLVSNQKDIYLVNLKEKKTILPVKFLVNTNNEQIYIEFAEDLKMYNDYKLHLEFAGLLDTSLKGFYRSTYKIPSTNTTKTIGVTQFEATDARKAYPCFDEPAMKAVYNMKMTRLPEYQIWFNMPKESERLLDNGLVEDTFMTTVKMSSYLVAFVVADSFTSIRAVTKNNVNISIITPDYMIKDAAYALEITESVLEYYVHLFGVAFPLPKLDLVAIPDFSAGAMENWGLITYRLTRILLNNETSSASDKQKVAMVISHEIAHQWFGNIVTMKWWTDLWLNEGFASYVEYLGIDQKYKEEWEMAKQFVSRDITTAMHKDCYYSSHPILIEVSNPNEINALFDTITYAKGATVIRMAKFMLTEEKLQLGLRNYMKRYQFDNTVTDQLWEEFSKVATNIDVTAIMKTWTNQMGYPVLRITRSGRTLNIQQKRFLIYAAGEDNSIYKSPYGYLWKIPFTVYQRDTPSSHRDNITILSDKDNTLQVAHPTDWYKANTDYFGYYRVNYDSQNWIALVDQLKKDPQVFSEMDRAQLIDDGFNLARAGQLDMKIAFDLTLYLTNETSFIVWSVVDDNTDYIMSRMNEHNLKMFKSYMSKQISNVIKYVGWEKQKKHITSMLQNVVLFYGVSLGHEETVRTAASKFSSFMADPVENKHFTGDLKDAVYLAGIKAGGVKEWNFLWTRFLDENTNSAEKYRIMNILAYSKNLTTLENYLEIAFDVKNVRKGDFMYVLRKVASMGPGGPLAWTFVKNNWEELFKRYGEGSFSMSRMVLATSSHFSTQQKYDEVKQFYDTHYAGSGAGSVSETLEKIAMNINYLDNNGNNIKDWLKEHSD